MTTTNTTINKTKPQTFKGVVVKSSVKDTIVVAVSRYVKHPKYKKYRTRIKKYIVHNPGNTVQVGETVTIVASRPISKMKSFIIVTSKV